MNRSYSANILNGHVTANSLTGSINDYNRYIQKSRTLGGAVNASIIELQKLLAEERIRSEQHKNNYQTLKTEFEKLKDNHKDLESEMVRTMEESQQQINQEKAEVARLATQLGRCQSELEVLRQNQITPEWTEIAQLEMEKKFEAEYEQRLNSIRAEEEVSRVECNRLRVENSFLRVQLEGVQAEASQIVDEKQHILEVEVSNLRKERKEILERRQNNRDEETEQLRRAMRERDHLQARIKVQAEEVAELSQQNKVKKRELDSKIRDLEKALVSSESAKNCLQLEVSSLTQQNQALQKELTNAHAKNLQFINSNTHLKKQHNDLLSQLDSVTQKAQLDIAQLKIEAAKQRSDIESQKNELAEKVDDLEQQLKLAGAGCSQLEESIKKRQLEFSKQETKIRNEEWKEKQSILLAKAELENTIVDLTNKMEQMKDKTMQRDLELDDREKKFKNDQKEITLKQNANQRQHEEKDAELKRLQHQLTNQTDIVMRQEVELADLYKDRNFLDQMKTKYEDLKQRFNDANLQINDLSKKNHNLLIEYEAEIKSVRERLQKRIGELERELQKSLETVNKLNTELKRKNKKHSRYFTSLRQKLELTRLKLEETQAENELLKENVPSNEFKELQKDYKDLTRRHVHYKNILMNSVPPQIIEKEPIKSNIKSVDNNANIFNDSDLNMISKSIDDLDTKQKNQRLLFEDLKNKDQNHSEPSEVDEDEELEREFMSNSPLSDKEGKLLQLDDLH